MNEWTYNSKTLWTYTITIDSEYNTDSKINYNFYDMSDGTFQFRKHIVAPDGISSKTLHKTITYEEGREMCDFIRKHGLPDTWNNEIKALFKLKYDFNKSDY